MTTLLAYFVVCLISNAVQRAVRSKKTNKGYRYDKTRENDKKSNKCGEKLGIE